MSYTRLTREEWHRAADRCSAVGHWEADTMIGKRGKGRLTAVESQ